MLLKSELREVLDKVLTDHLEDTESEDDVRDITEAILDKLEDRFPVVDDEELTPDDEE